mgnify:FL=1
MWLFAGWPYSFPMADLTTSPDAFTEKPVSNENARWRVIWRNAFPFIVVGLIWEAVARAGVFPAKLFPTIETIAAAFWRLTMNGILQIGRAHV